MSVTADDVKRRLLIAAGLLASNESMLALYRALSVRQVVAEVAIIAIADKDPTRMLLVASELASQIDDMFKEPS